MEDVMPQTAAPEAISVPALTTITGRCMNQIMRDLQTSYTVWRVKTETDIMVCSGHIIPPPQGTFIEVTGKLTDTKWGRQLTECTIREDYTDRESLRAYLMEVPGIGPSAADGLLNAFGGDLFDIALGDNGASNLATVPGVTPAKAAKIITHLKRTKTFRELFVLVTRHGGKYAAAAKIYKEYHEESIERLKENPYEFEHRYGLPYAVCDAIAGEYGILPLSKIRIIGAIKHCLRAEATAGNSYAEMADLVRSVRLTLCVTQVSEAVTTACINSQLMTDNADNGFRVVGNRVYLTAVYHQERRVSYAVKRLLRYRRPIRDFSHEQLIAYAEKKCSAKYAEQQREALGLLLNGGLCILTGGPGTGKSTVIRGLLASYEMMRPDGVIKLCAPTGRAAQRMKECTGHEATTIHKLLEYRPFGDRVACKDESDPIDADLLIVDESSMISLELADILLAAIPSGTAVILVGDVNQLPAVGAGNVLCDLIESNVVPKVMLTQTFRQAEGSVIIENGKRILNGVTKLRNGTDFEIVTVPSDNELPGAVIEQFTSYNKQEDPFFAQVLSPARRKKPTGSTAMSNTLQKHAGIAMGGTVLRYGDITFHAGDKVMFMRNNYAGGYFNGDIGTVKSVDETSLVIDVEGEPIEVQESDLDDLQLAYCITVHKLQGSECNTAIIELPAQPANMLQKNLLYTAITRAKKKVVLVATEGSIEKAILNKTAYRRKSGLVRLLI